MTDRILTPVIAFGLAFLVWMYSRSRDQETIYNFPVPVEVSVHPSQAANYALDKLDTATVGITFSGPPSRVRELRRMLHQNEIPLARTVIVPEDHKDDPEYTTVLKIDPAQVPVPPGIAVLLPEAQNRIQVTLRRMVEKQLPVKFVHDAGNRIEAEIIEPSVVTVRGPKQVLERMDHIPTLLYSVPDRRSANQLIVLDKPEVCPLAVEASGRRIEARPNSVQIRFTLKPLQTVRELTEVPVHFLCPSNFPFRPEFRNERDGKITLQVRGPTDDVRPQAMAYVDLTVRKFGPGLHPEEPLRVQLPTGYQLVSDPPRLSSFRLVPIDAPAKPPP